MSSRPTERSCVGLEAKYSCLVCHKRKVKCDRGKPCSNCSRNNIECEYRAPPAPRRRKKRGIDPAIADKIRRYEEQLRKSGVELDEDGEIIHDDAADTSNQDDTDGEINPRPRPTKSRTDSRTQTPLKNEDGALILEAGKSRYLESGLWVTLSGQLQNQQPLIQDQPENATEDDSSQSASNSQPLSILLGKPRRADRDPIENFPRPDHVSIIWREFLRNVDPIVKMIHAPTIEKMVQLSCHNVHSLPRNKLTLLFSIFLGAVSSMTDDEVRAKLGQSKSSLYKRYACATERCFVRCGLLRTTDINMLIAFMLYLFATRQLADPQVVFTLVGVAYRIAQRIGLHKENATGLKPFDLEIRRRTWKQLCILDWASAELAGASSMLQFFPEWWSQAGPRNLNDTDIHQNMTELPPDRVGATDMIFCLLRCEFGNFFNLLKPGFEGNQPPDLTIEEQDHFVNELEKQLEQKFLRYCDPINPLHAMVTVVSRSALCSIRIRLYHPSRFTDGAKSFKGEEHAKIFQLSLKALQYDNLVLTTASLKRFHWHTRDFFQIHPVIYLLISIRVRRVGEEVEEAWQLLECAYQNRPELLARRKGLHIALGMLALQAWDAREAELKRLGLPVKPPIFITKLRSTESGILGNDRQNNSSTGVQKHQTDPQPTQAQPSTPSLNWVPQWNQIGVPQGLIPETGTGWEPGVDWAQWEQLMYNNSEAQINNEFGFNTLDGYFMPMQN